MFVWVVCIVFDGFCVLMFVYVSMMGVYGDCGGVCIDEM